MPWLGRAILDQAVCLHDFKLRRSPQRPSSYAQACTSRTQTDSSAVVFDPLDGSSNIDAGVNVGTIFGVYKVVSQIGPITGGELPLIMQKEDGKGGVEDCLRPGKEMVAAGYTM
jgi:fructose-1,6-bisphosphatase